MYKQLFFRAHFPFKKKKKKKKTKKCLCLQMKCESIPHFTDESDIYYANNQKKISAIFINDLGKFWSLNLEISFFFLGGAFGVFVRKIIMQTHPKVFVTNMAK